MKTVKKDRAGLARERLRKANWFLTGTALNNVTESVFEIWCRDGHVLILHNMHEDGWDPLGYTSLIGVSFGDC